MKYFFRFYSLVQILCLRSWWVFLFGFLSLTIHERYSIHQQKVKVELNQKLTALELEKFEALRLNEELKLRIASHSDPAYVELVLIRILGVVPEGEKKIYFVE